MNYKYIALGLLLSGALLAAPSFAGVTDVTGGTTSSTYKHTYHTKVDAHADMTFYHYTTDEDGNTVFSHTTSGVIDHESGFVVGNISDSAVQAEIAKYESMVDSYRHSCTYSNRQMVFDHFESANLVDQSKDAILVGDIDDLTKAYSAQGHTSKTLDVHEYQVYQINEAYNVSPIVLDLDGDGKIEASNGKYLAHSDSFKSEGATMFDFNGNGFPVYTEWVGTNDGLLCRPNADGTINGTNLFGTANGYANGYDEMSSLDKNNDGVLSGAELEGLFVWQDKNANGIADAGELTSVQALGISSISVNHDNMVGSFVRNGQTFKSFDWWPSVKDVRRMDVARL